MFKRISTTILLFLFLFSTLTIYAAGKNDLEAENGGFWSPSVEAAPLNLLDMERSPDGIVHIIGHTSCCPTGISYTQRDLAGSWSALEIVDDDIDSSRPWEADMVIASDGTVHVIWADQAGTFNHQVHYSKRNAVDNWSSEVPLAAPTHNTNGLTLLINDTDQLYASWFSYGQTGLFTNYQVGGVWNGIQRVDTNPAANDPVVLIDNQQNIHYFWFYADINNLQNSGVFYRKQQPDNSFGNVIRISDTPPSPGVSGQLFASIDGQNLYATWGFQEGSNQNIYFADFTNGSWNGQTKLNTTNSSFYPIFIGASGNNVYILNGENNSSTLTFRFRPSGGSWSSEPLSFIGANPIVTALVSPDNTFHLIWDDQNTPIQYRTRKNLGAWSTDEQIGGAFGFGKRIFIQNGGHYDFAWEDNGNDTNYSHGQAFTTLPPQGYIPTVLK